MNGKIALEEHFATDETVRESPEFGHAGEWSVLERRLLDVGAERLREMDANGIAFAILSLNAPGVQSVFDPKRAVGIAARANDALAAAVSKHPDRFGGFAAVPLQDPDAACAELTRAVKTLGFKGVMANGFSQIGDASNVTYLDDPRYAPFWATVAELGVPFYLHPRDPLPERTTFYDGHPWLRGAAWAFGVETATHALRLMASGVFDRHPALTVILGHLGEGLPYNIWRVDHRFAKRPRVMPPVKRRLSEYLRDNFYVTTSGSFHDETLRSAIAELGAGRVMFSVDYPFEECGQAASWFDGCDLSADERQKIGRANAAQLFGLK
ncbi:MAG TPA: amidohydrolase family protein [Vicinamibacterales bacterium]|nr:amidohydrolase family protein [Vicinamibacterales bacterium]